MKQQVSNTTAYIIIAVIVALLVGGGIYYWRKSTPSIDPMSQEALQMQQSVDQEYGGGRGMAPPPGSAGAMPR